MKNWPSLYQKHGQTPLKNVNFMTFWTFCFDSLETSFFVLEYRKRHFPGLYCGKKKVGKMAIFGPKAWVDPFEKMSIFRLFELLFFKNLERRLLVLEYLKRHFPDYNCLKKKLGKMAIFVPKAWVNPFGIMSIIRLFELLVFIA